MRRLDSPGLTPTSQVQGDDPGNAAAMAPAAHPPIPVSSPRPQPSTDLPSGSPTWVLTESAGS